MMLACLHACLPLPRCAHVCVLCVMCQVRSFKLRQEKLEGKIESIVLEINYESRQWKVCLLCASAPLPSYSSLSPSPRPRPHLSFCPRAPHSPLSRAGVHMMLKARDDV